MRTLTLTISLLCCWCVLAQESPKISLADKQANVAIRLFINACTPNLGDISEVKSWIQKNKLRATKPRFSQKVLQGKKGEVWSASNRIGDFIVIVGSPYRCAVWARRANARLAIEYFNKLIQDTKRPGLSVTLYKDQEIAGYGGQYRQLVYLLKKDGAETGWAALATVSESTTAEAQVRFTIAVGK